MKKSALILFIIGLFSNSIQAQTTASHSVQIIARPILGLSFDDSEQNTSFNFETVNDYEKGITNLNAATLKVKANKNWVVNVKANTENFSIDLNTLSALPSTILSVKKSGTDLFLPVKSSDQILASGSFGGLESNKLGLDYAANPGFILPGAYELEITYTITTP